MKCVAQQGSYAMNVCQEERDDYMECLHHTKLVSGPYKVPVHTHILLSPCLSTCSK